jgi:hypothetical protein
MGATIKQSQEFHDSPMFWFVRLEKAREQQDHETAAEAIQNLRRLGVLIRFGTPQVEVSK